MAVLGIDLGTGSVKAAIVEEDGSIRRFASRSYAVNAPHPGWAETDPAAWLEGVESAAAEVLEGQSDVNTVGFSGQMHGVVLTDDANLPLGPAILWADARATEQARELGNAFGSADLARLGSPAVPGFAATTLRWLGQHTPGELDQAAAALQPKDFLRVALGGDIATDPSDASGTLLYDVVDSCWSSQAVAWAQINPILLPEVRASHAPAGSVRIADREFACVVGGADTACALAGLGLGPGDGFVAVGTGSQTVSMMRAPAVDASLRTHTFAATGALGEAWYRIGAVQNAGLSLDRALSMLAATADEATAALERGVRESDPLFVPYLAGERTPFMNPDLRGAWLGLSLATDREALLRSVLEGVAHAVAFGITAVEESGARLPDVIPLVGGGTHALAFRQLLADASGHSLAVAEAPNAAVVGAGYLAMGQVKAPEQAALGEPVIPRPKVSEVLAVRRDRIRAWIEAS